ncbi:hypothetical protein HD554DRAFT_866241 [Boletus coccyginus]|nr:hypothetical protein HD554DRAFT_866241 [Boletus coccyginus]
MCMHGPTGLMWTLVVLKNVHSADPIKKARREKSGQIQARTGDPHIQHHAKQIQMYGVVVCDQLLLGEVGFSTLLPITTYHQLHHMPNAT